MGPKNEIWPPLSTANDPDEVQLADWRKRARNMEVIIKTDERRDPAYTWKPIPYDPRFPNIDITNRCYSSYIDYHRCRKLRGTDYEPCEYFKHVFTGICPSSWYKEWNEQRRNKVFPGDISINAPANSTGFDNDQYPYG